MIKVDCENQQTNKPTNQQRLDTIQILRGVAAFVVVLCHIHFIKIGEFGVDIFFCISGFIMMYITEKDGRNFLQKRAIRILPLYYGITLITFCVILIAPSLFNSSEATPEYLLKSFLFIPYERNGIIQPVLGVGWTLNYEIWFYFLFYISTKIKKEQRHFICSAILILISVIGLIIKTESVVFNFFTSPIIIEFVLGMFAFVIYKRFIVVKKSIKLKTLLKIISLFMFLTMCSFGFYTCFIAPLKINRLFIYGIPAFIMFLCFIAGFRDSKLPKFAVILGNISFSLYLVHYYTIFFFDRIVYSFDALNIMSFCVALIAISCSVAVAFVSWKLFEDKFTKRLLKLFKI